MPDRVVSAARHVRFWTSAETRHTVELVNHKPGRILRMDAVGFRSARRDVLAEREYGGDLGQSGREAGAMTDRPPVPVFMSTDSAVRKSMPVASGFGAYFPDAMLLVSWVSRVGAEKHCGGVLGWDKAKSQDEKDCEWRHMLDALRGLPPDPGLEPLGELGHLASKAWRAMADLQRACDEIRAEQPIPYALTDKVWAEPGEDEAGASAGSG